VACKAFFSFVVHQMKLIVVELVEELKCTSAASWVLQLDSQFAVFN
jgi:hypothetical protein